VNVVSWGDWKLPLTPLHMGMPHKIKRIIWDWCSASGVVGWGFANGLGHVGLAT
jgi:hypothetical protein